MKNYTLGPWYESSTSNGQGLIASEKTGESIAVSYDKKNAQLIAAAPKLLECIQDCNEALRILYNTFEQFGHFNGKEVLIESMLIDTNLAIEVST